jgi:methyl-accepting chemotaxis protein
MKLSTRLALIVLGAVAGLLLLTALSLYSLRNTMLEERKDGLRILVQLAGKQVLRYQALEKSGMLSRDDAQAAAKEALRGLHQGDEYVFARSGKELLLSIVHPDQRREGKESDGGRLPNGKTVTGVYLEALQQGDFAFVDIYTKRPGGNEEVPKINAIQRIPDWGWVVGSGVFIDDVDRAFWRYLVEFGLISGAILLGIVVLAVSLARGIYRSIGGEPAYAASVAYAIAAGDMTQSVRHNGTASSLLSGVADMLENLKRMIGQIKQGAATLGTASDALTQQMKQINFSAQNSSEATSSTAAAIEQMSVSVSEISTNARDTETRSRRSAELASAGEKLVHQAATELGQVVTRVADASSRIAGLAERSREIGGIANVIKEIADQTNLLALNAAIEAARAGEQGRGFAVVADEVRKLAERTANATGQITAMIQGVQTDTDAVVGSMQSVAPQVAKSVSIANDAASTLHEINSGASATLDNIRDVAHATAEQSIANESVASNIEKIAQMVEEMATSVDVANDNVQTLESLAVDLRASVERFRV